MPPPPPTSPPPTSPPAASPLDASPLDALPLPPFAPPRWLADGRLQTLSTLAPRPGLDAFARAAEDRLFEVAEGTRVRARCHWQADRRAAPTLVLLHGLTGSSDSRYLLGTARAAHAAGFNALRLDMRGQGGTEALTPTIYHGGLSNDPERVLRELGARDGLDRLVLAGFSLGGNVALRLAGTLGEATPPGLLGVVAVSPPIDLAACADLLERTPFNRLLSLRFLAEFRAAYERRERHWPREVDPAVARRVHSLRDWDDRWTAPLSGYRDAAAYYADASAVHRLGGARVPCLVLHASDDPLIGPEPLAAPGPARNPRVRVELLPAGGHVSFLGSEPAVGPRGPDPDRRWAEHRVVDAAAHLVAEAGAPLERPSRGR